jgi:hypothetical protein
MQLAWDLVFKLLPYIAGLVILWTIVGAVSGLVVGVVASALTAKMGGFAHDWKHAIWFRIVSVLFIVLGFGALGGLIGLWQGALSGLDEALREGPFQTEVLLRAGRAGASGLTRIDVFLQEKAGGSAGAQAHWEAFQRGEREWNVVQLLARLDRAESQIVQEATKQAKTELRTRWDIPEHPWVESILDVVLAALVKKAVREKAGEALSDQGIDVAPLFTGLPQLAQAQGDPETVTFDELSNHVVDGAVIPAIEGPSKAIVRSQQLMLALGFPIVGLIPVLGFWIGRVISRRRRADRAAP